MLVSLARTTQGAAGVYATAAVLDSPTSTR